MISPPQPRYWEHHWGKTHLIRFGDASDAQDPETVARILWVVNTAYRAAYSSCLEDPEIAEKLAEAELTEILRETKQQRRRLLLASERSCNGKIVGVVTVCTEWHGERLGHFGMLATDPDVQGSGVGSALLERVEAECVAAGVPRIQCEQFVLPPAQAVKSPIRFLSEWYQRRGYNIVSSRTVPAGLESCGTITCLPLELLFYIKHI